jgi:hypothetical protein
VAAGAAHTCARRLTGQTLCWGAGQGGRLGRRQRPSIALSRRREADARHREELAVGGEHSCARSLDRRVWCWGRGGSGQIGDGSQTDYLVPVPRGRADGVDQIAGRAPPTGCARTRGQAWCWGANEAGQLGRRQARTTAPSPAAWRGLDACRLWPPAAPTAARWPATGKVWCWGDGKAGQLGAGGAPRANRPVAAAIDGIVEIAAGAAHTCARDGRRPGLVLGPLGATPPPIARSPSRAERACQAISAGGGHACASARRHRLVLGRQRQRAARRRHHPDRHAPDHGLRLGHASQISAGGAHSCAVSNGACPVLGLEHQPPAGRRPAAQRPAAAAGHAELPVTFGRATPR